MKTKKISILLAAIVLIAAQLACAVGEPTFSNVRVAKDQDGAQITNTFGAFDTIYVVGDLANGIAGNQITSRWYAENVPGLDPNFLLDEAVIDVTTDQEPFNGVIYFYFPPQSDGWPAGSYKVEIYFNGTLNSTVNFTVQ